MQDITEIDFEQVDKISEVFKKLNLDRKIRDGSFLGSDASLEVKLRHVFNVTAICHQTRKLRNEKRKLYGWGYLTHVFKQHVKKATWLMPDKLANMPVEEVASILSLHFTDDKNKLALENPEQRAELLIDAARIIVDKYDGLLSNLLPRGDALLINHGEGLYERLQEFKAYSDPLKKKSSVLLRNLENNGLIHIMDYENFVPIVDYHIMREILRTGSVEVNDYSVFKKLQLKADMETDEPFRSSTVTVLGLISESSGKSKGQVSDAFWAHSRSCCEETPICSGSLPNSKVKTLERYIGPFKECIFQSACKGCGDKSYRKLWEPMVKTTFY